MADIVVKALYASVVEDDEDGMVFVGFAAGEAEDEDYTLFRQPLAGGPVWFEVNDEAFGAEDALESVVLGLQGIEITLARPASYGWAKSVLVQIGPECEDAAEALAALQAMLGEVWRG